MSTYEEVCFYDAAGEIEYSYVERVVETHVNEEPPDDYYDERPADESVPSWADQPVTASAHTDPWATGGYSMEPPF
ncbi:hypothetical protein [Streptomyces sp. NPDC004726]